MKWLSDQYHRRSKRCSSSGGTDQCPASRARDNSKVNKARIRKVRQIRKMKVWMMIKITKAAKISSNFKKLANHNKNSSIGETPIWLWLMIWDCWRRKRHLKLENKINSWRAYSNLKSWKAELYGRKIKPKPIAKPQLYINT